MMVNQNKIKTTLLASLGAGLEYYDFVVYGLLARYLAAAFFPATSTLASTLQVFSVFALGYFVRPFGGMFFGHMGDRYGRKKVFLASMSLMAFATLLMGMLPTHQEAGWFATIGLIVLRALQGFAFGAEFPGTVTFLVEHVRAAARGMHSGIMLASVSLGGLLASGLLAMITHYFSAEEMSIYAWRIPFLLGGGVAVFAYILRAQLQETPLFLQQEGERIAWPLYHLFTQFPARLILGTGMGLLGMCLVIFQITLPTFLQTYYHYEASEIYLVISLSFVWATLILPLIGYISDRISRLGLLLSMASSVLIGCFALFQLLNQSSFIALVGFILIVQTLASFLTCAYLPLITELFPTAVRLSGVALCYNMGYLIASLTPMLVNQWAAFTGGAELTYLFFVLLASVTFISAVSLRVMMRIRY